PPTNPWRSAVSPGDSNVRVTVGMVPPLPLRGTALRGQCRHPPPAGTDLNPSGPAASDGRPGRRSNHPNTVPLGPRFEIQVATAVPAVHDDRPGLPAAGRHHDPVPAHRWDARDGRRALGHRPAVAVRRRPSPSGWSTVTEPEHDAANAVAIAFVHTDEVMYSWVHSLLQLLDHDLAGKARV